MWLDGYPIPILPPSGVMQIAAYYLALAGGIALLYQVNPNFQGVFTMERFSEAVASSKSALAYGLAM